MCLAVPGKILSVENAEDPLLCRGKVDFRGVTRVVELALIESPRVGEFVLVHGGTALERVVATEAEEIWALLQELGAAEEGQL